MTLQHDATLYEEAGIVAWPSKRDNAKMPALGGHRHYWSRHDKEMAPPALLAKVWKRRPDSNLVILTGKASGLCIVDFDVPDDPDPAVEEANELIRARLAPTVIDVSDKGGAHYWYRLTPEMHAAYADQNGHLKTVAPLKVRMPDGRLQRSSVDVLLDTRVLAAPGCLRPDGSVKSFWADPFMTTARFCAELHRLPEIDLATFNGCISSGDTIETDSNPWRISQIAAKKQAAEVARIEKKMGIDLRANPRALSGHYSSDESERRFAAYVATWRPVTQGARNDAIYKGAIHAARFGVSEAHALFVLRQWHASNVSPPLSDKELRGAVRSGYNEPRVIHGSALAAERPRNDTTLSDWLAKTYEADAYDGPRPQPAPRASEPEQEKPRKGQLITYDQRKQWQAEELSDYTTTRTARRNGQKLRTCCLAWWETICAIHGLVMKRHNRCESMRCPSCAHKRAKFIYDHIEATWPAKVAILTSLPIPDSMSAEHRLSAVDTWRRDAAMGMKKAAKRMKRGLNHRWVLGADLSTYFGPADLKPVYREASHGRRAEVRIVSRRKAAIMAHELLTSYADMISDAAHLDPSALNKHPVIEMGRRVRTSATKGGRELFPWLTGEAIRDAAREAAAERRNGVAVGACPALDDDGEPCGRSTSIRVYHARTGEPILQDDGSTPIHRLERQVVEMVEQMMSLDGITPPADHARCMHGHEPAHA